MAGSKKLVIAKIGQSENLEKLGFEITRLPDFGNYQSFPRSIHLDLDLIPIRVPDER